MKTGRLKVSEKNQGTHPSKKDRRDKTTTTAGEERTRDGGGKTYRGGPGLETGKEDDPGDPWAKAFDHLFDRTQKDFDLFCDKTNDLLTSCAKSLISTDELKDYHTVFLWTQKGLSDLHLSEIHTHLKKNNVEGKLAKDILLIVHNDGGFIEPAFQISKICNDYKKNKFIVAVPRRAKSAATLVAMGADEIHMGDLGQLGPIDPHIEGLPALGVYDVLDTLAEVVTTYPKSVDLFSQFLEHEMDFGTLGWLVRVPESAHQYAQKLLSKNYTEEQHKDQIKKIAQTLVKGYKDHGFIIDAEEARVVLGNDIGKKMIKTNTKIIDKVEHFYSQLSEFETCVDCLWENRNGKSSLQIEIVGEPLCEINIY